MIALKIFLLIINIFSFGVAIVFMLIEFFEHLFGEEPMDKFLEKIKFPISYEKRFPFGLICMVVALISFIIREQLW